jgi:uncharacterized lipoprotein
MTKKFARQFLLTLALLAALTACSSGQKVPEYYDAQETPSLDMPDGLSYPDTSSALIIQMRPMPPPAMVMETKPPRVSSTTAGINANSRLHWSAEGLYLLVEDTPESTQRRIGLVLERSGMKRIRLDDKGVYRFDYYQTFEDEDGFFSKMAFWSRDEVEDYSGAYQTYVEPDGEQTRVYIKYADGTECEADAAEHVLEAVRQRMG